jgi:hypothetical protein
LKFGIDKPFEDIIYAIETAETGTADGLSKRLEEFAESLDGFSKQIAESAEYYEKK